MWYIKDYRGNESGPYDLDQLLELLKKPELKENATLIRSDDWGGWKPALIAFPFDELDAVPDDSTSPSDLSTRPDETDSKRILPAVINPPIAASDPQHHSLNQIAKELNRSRLMIFFSSFYFLILTLIPLTRAGVAGSNSALTLTNTLIACGVIMLLPLGKLFTLVRTPTNHTLESIQATVSLHRAFWTAFFLSSTLSAGILLIVLLLL